MSMTSANSPSFDLQGSGMKTICGNDLFAKWTLCITLCMKLPATSVSGLMGLRLLLLFFLLLLYIVYYIYNNLYSNYVEFIVLIKTTILYYTISIIYLYIITIYITISIYIYSLSRYLYWNWCQCQPTNWQNTSTGLTERAAHQKWKESFNDMSIRRDQVRATNSEGEDIGQAGQGYNRYDRWQYKSPSRQPQPKN